jgi:phosphoribosyl 1,2-cyclic phosphodiesterase
MPLGGTMGTWQAAGLGAEDLPGYERLEPGARLRLGQLTIRAIAVPHDAAGPVAFVISAGETSFGHATDLGHLSPDLVAAFRSCQAVLMESNFDPAMLRDGPYPWSLKERILGPLGHLSNGDVGRFLERGLGPECRQVILAHLSQKNNHPDLALLTAEEALQRGGRGETRVTLATPGGTGWIRVQGGAEGPGAEAGQLRLF